MNFSTKDEYYKLPGTIIPCTEPCELISYVEPSEDQKYGSAYAVPIVAWKITTNGNYVYAITLDGSTTLRCLGDDHHDTTMVGIRIRGRFVVYGFGEKWESEVEYIKDLYSIWQKEQAEKKVV